MDVVDAFCAACNVVTHHCMTNIKCYQSLQERFLSCVFQGGCTHIFDLSQKAGTLLPMFPDAKYLILPENISLKEVG